VALEKAGLLDVHRRIVTRGSRVLIPAIAMPPFELTPFQAAVEMETLPSMVAARPPIDRIRGRLPEALRSAIPPKWERLGDVVLLRLPPELQAHRELVGEAFGEVLGARTVAVYGPIGGPWREPAVEVIWGDGTETEHVENGIRYRLDVAKTMFSSGNLPERIRMGRIVQLGETVVDLFAGIGYFALPMAVHGRARVYACEVNPVAYRYLEENARVNRAGGLLPLAGDCRQVAPRGVADRVVLGYLEGSDYLPVAMASLRGRGWLHYHEVCPAELCSSRPAERVARAATDAGMAVKEQALRYLKSYAPGVWHVVLDARLGPS